MSDAWATPAGGLAPAPRRQDSLAPAFLAALALHLALLAAVVFLHGTRPLPLGDVTPITIVAKGPVTDSRPAEAAAQVQSAQAEQPAPAQTAPPPPPAPPVAAPRQPAPPRLPKPQPVAKPVPIPTPAPKARPVPVRPTPAKPSPAPPAPAKDTFLERLAQSLPPSRRPPGPPRGARGPTRAETAPEPRVDAGQGVSQSDLQGLQQLLERLWNPNCAAPGGDQAVIPVRFSIDGDGRVTGRIVEHVAEDTAAARRAIDAVHQAEPYAAAYRNNTFTVNFDARKACAGREE